MLESFVPATASVSLMFEKAGKKNATVVHRQFWQQHNKPIELWTVKVIQQKIDYIHKNPVKPGFVTDPVD